MFLCKSSRPMIDDVSLKVVKAPSKFACQLSILKMQSFVKLFSIELARNTHPLLLKTLVVVFVLRATREREKFLRCDLQRRERRAILFFSGGVLSLKNLHSRWIDF